MPAPDVQQRMREDWDLRAREDAHYYVAFGRRRQDSEEFFASANEALHAIRFDLRRFPSVKPPQLRALEIGCGPGRLLVPLSRDFGSIVGVDVSPEMVELARANLEGIPNARAELTSGADLAGLEDDSFDFCYSYAVFQHIPSREVVRSYLREARRVLKPGGVLKCQLNGLPEDSRHRADTWSGVRLRPGEIRRFCLEHDMQLLLLDGIDTQNLWMTARKQPAGWVQRLRPVPAARILTISNSYTSDLLVPAAGRFSSASLWVSRLTDDADLNNLQVEIAGQLESPSYIGAFPWKDPVQVNVFLPPEVPTGMVPARLWMLGEPISNFAHIRVIPRPPAVPRVLSVTDGVNLVSDQRIETRTVMVHVEEVGRNPDLSAEIDGVPVPELRLSCIDPLCDRYAMSMDLPVEIGPGSRRLTVRLRGRPLPPVPIEIVR